MEPLSQITFFLSLPENKKWRYVCESAVIEHRTGIWFVRPNLIVEKFMDDDGIECFRPIESFDRYLLNITEVAGKLYEISQGSIDWYGVKRFLELLN